MDVCFAGNTITEVAAGLSDARSWRTGVALRLFLFACSQGHPRQAAAQAGLMRRLPPRLRLLPPALALREHALHDAEQALGVPRLLERRRTLAAARGARVAPHPLGERRRRVGREDDVLHHARVRSLGHERARRAWLVLGLPRALVVVRRDPACEGGLCRSGVRRLRAQGGDSPTAFPGERALLRRRCSIDVGPDFGRGLRPKLAVVEIRETFAAPPTQATQERATWSAPQCTTSSRGSDPPLHSQRLVADFDVFLSVELGLQDLEPLALLGVDGAPTTSARRCCGPCLHARCGPAATRRYHRIAGRLHARCGPAAGPRSAAPTHGKSRWVLPMQDRGPTA
jgi:hypothetical protein